MDCTCGNLGAIIGTGMASHGFIGCLSIVFVIVQMVELLDTAANIAVYLTSGASARI